MYEVVHLSLMLITKDLQQVEMPNNQESVRAPRATLVFLMNDQRRIIKENVRKLILNTTHGIHTHCVSYRPTAPHSLSEHLQQEHEIPKRKCRCCLTSSQL